MKDIISRFSLSMKKLKTSLLFSQFKFLDCPKQGKDEAILVILQSEQININFLKDQTKLYMNLEKKGDSILISKIVMKFCYFSSVY